MYSLEKEIRTAVRILKKGGVIVAPTDTVYGLITIATNKESVEKMSNIKGRINKPVLIVVPNKSIAKKYVIFSQKASEIFEKTKGRPITLVLPLKKYVPDSIRTLSAKTSFLGVRIPDNPILQEILSQVKEPLTASSANISGKPTPKEINKIRLMFKNKKIQPDFYLDGGPSKTEVPSAVWKIYGRKIETIRTGNITLKEILNQRETE